MTRGEWSIDVAAHEDIVRGNAVHDRSCRKAGRIPTCGGAFECGRCGHIVGWCKGAADNYPNWCNACVLKHEKVFA